MASGDSDQIEVMESAVSKKTEIGIGPSGSEDDGTTLLNLIIKQCIPVLLIAFLLEYLQPNFLCP